MGRERTMNWWAEWTRLCVLVALSVTMGCVSNPTPHPGQTDATMPTGAEPTLGAGEATEGSDDPSPSGPPNGMDLDDSGDAVVGAAVDGGVDDVGTGDVTGPVGQDDGGP